MEHVPSGHFSANSAWLQCAVLAHNLIRWTTTLGQPGPVERLTVAAQCASVSSPCPAASSTAREQSPCEGRPGGRGRGGSLAGWSGYGPCSPRQGNAPLRPAHRQRRPALKTSKAMKA